MRLAGGHFGIEYLMPVPDLYLGRASQIDAAVGLGHGPVFDQQFDVTELLVGRCVRPTAVVDQLAVLDGPVLRELGSLLRESRLPLFARQGRNAVRVQAVPAGEIPSIEDRAEAIWRTWLLG